MGKPNSEQFDSARIPNIAIPKTTKNFIPNEVRNLTVEMGKQMPFTARTFSSAIKVSTTPAPQYLWGKRPLP